MKRARAIRVRDLKDLLGTDDRPFLKCLRCGQEASAHKEDYFLVAPDTKFKCCGVAMRLVRRVTSFVEVTE